VQRLMASKVPQVTLFFWVIKILSTTMGETLADWMDATFHLGLTGTTLVCGAAFIAMLFWQMRTRAYVPAVYWATVILVSITGTLITDNLTDGLGVSLYVSTAIFAILLAVVFRLWWRQERTLDIASINTTRREAWYWLAILVTFALGTAAGDLITEGWGLGYGPGLALFAALVAGCYIAYRARVNEVLTFWIAYVLTRPLGASLGDLLTAPTRTNADYDYTGFGLPRYGVNVLFLAVVIGLVVYLSISKRDSLEAPAAS
jgi:uncharacterized membrane-anchored protein